MMETCFHAYGLLDVKYSIYVFRHWSLKTLQWATNYLLPWESISCHIYFHSVSQHCKLSQFSLVFTGNRTREMFLAGVSVSLWPCQG